MVSVAELKTEICSGRAPQLLHPPAIALEVRSAVEKDAVGR
jgi:hypothetical protein